MEHRSGDYWFNLNAAALLERAIVPILSLHLLQNDVTKKSSLKDGTSYTRLDNYVRKLLVVCLSVRLGTPIAAPSTLPLL